MWRLHRKLAAKRVRDAESRIGTGLTNGPRRACGKAEAEYGMT